MAHGYDRHAQPHTHTDTIHSAANDFRGYRYALQFNIQ